MKVADQYSHRSPAAPDRMAGANDCAGFIDAPEMKEKGCQGRLCRRMSSPRVEYRLTAKGHEPVESVLNLLEWMRKWSGAKR